MNMKKNLFYIAAILIASICATSCSNGDDETTNGATPQQSKNSEVTLRGALANGVTTRSTITVNGSNLTSTWAGTDNVPEEIAVRLRTYGYELGMAFQYRDDLLDDEQVSFSALRILGRDEVLRRIATHTAAATDALKGLPGETTPLADLAARLAARDA